MFIDNFYSEEKWKLVDIVNDGNSYLIQNTNSFDVEFIVSNNLPSNDVLGGVLCSNMQLAFKKVTGSLYVRSPVKARLYVEQVEE